MLKIIENQLIKLTIFLFILLVSVSCKTNKPFIPPGNSGPQLSYPMIHINGISGKYLYLSQNVLNQLDSLEIYPNKYKIKTFSFGWYFETSDMGYKSYSNQFTDIMKGALRSKGCYRAFLYDFELEDNKGKKVELQNFTSIIIIPYENCY